MVWGKVTVGGIELREELLATDNLAALRIAGQEAHPPEPVSHVQAVHHNIVAAAGLIVPVTFTDKVSLSGFYRVAESNSELMRWANGAVETATWSMTLERIGGARDVEIESRVPLVARGTGVANPPAAVFWHAPAGGATSYFTGPTVPAASIQRVSADGIVDVHLGLPAGAFPRWTAPAEAYLLGAARLLIADRRRIGTLTPPLTVWEVNNGLVQLTPGADGSFRVACWDDGQWRSSKGFRVLINGTPVTSTPELTVIRNDPEEVVARLSYPTSPGRLTVDLGLRRGSRFVTGVLKRHSAAALRIQRTDAEAATAATGGLRATDADPDGNRFVIGSMATVTTTTATASITRASATTLDFFIGHEVSAAPQPGDAYADLWSQYRGSTGEQVRVVLR